VLKDSAPNTTSDLAFRGVLQGRSSAVWKGNIIVDPGAQKTDAFQESRNLLLSPEAHADAICTPHRNGGLRDLQQEARTVFDGTTVFIRALVGAVLEKLVG